MHSEFKWQSASDKANMDLHPKKNLFNSNEKSLFSLRQLFASCRLLPTRKKNIFCRHEHWEEKQLTAMTDAAEFRSLVVDWLKIIKNLNLDNSLTLKCFAMTQTNYRKPKWANVVSRTFHNATQIKRRKFVFNSLYLSQSKNFGIARAEVDVGDLSKRQAVN